MPRYNPWALSNSARFEETKTFHGKDIHGNDIEITLRCQHLDAIEVAASLQKAEELLVDFGGSKKIPLPDSSSTSLPVRILQNVCFLETMQLPCEVNEGEIYDFLTLVGVAKEAPKVYAQILGWGAQFIPGGAEGN